METTAQPLSGVRVIDFTQVMMGPSATQVLADYGADVIKIERPGAGDFARSYDDRVAGLASHFVWVNRSKESLTLDVKRPGAMLVTDLLNAQLAVL